MNLNSCCFGLFFRLTIRVAPWKSNLPTSSAMKAVYLKELICSFVTNLLLRLIFFYVFLSRSEAIKAIQTMFYRSRNINRRSFKKIFHINISLRPYLNLNLGNGLPTTSTKPANRQACWLFDRQNVTSVKGVCRKVYFALQSFSNRNGLTIVLHSCHMQIPPNSQLPINFIWKLFNRIGRTFGTIQ